MTKPRIRTGRPWSIPNRAITRLWPKGLAAGSGCTLQNIRGKVVRVDIVKGSRGLAFDRAARRAVVEASPLPLPENRALFGRALVFMCPE